MSDGTHIEWTDASWNPVRSRVASPESRVGWACQRVSPGCQHCYAETINRRLGTGLGYDARGLAGGVPFLDERVLLQPLKWRKARKVFVCSMTDIAGDWVSDEWLDRMFAVMALTPQHTYQVLTKRPGRLREYLGDGYRSVAVSREAMLLPFTARQDSVVADRVLWGKSVPDGGFLPAGFAEWPLPNVWVGTSVEDQERADERIPELLGTPAAVRFLSCEPLLGPVTLAPSFAYDARGRRDYTEDDQQRPIVPGQFHGLDWVIVGGESGPGARPMDVAWARSLVGQCGAAGVAVFVKQLGAKPCLPFTEEGAAEWWSGKWQHKRGVSYERLDGRRVGYAVKLGDRKGGDMGEWPADLRVREWPAPRTAVAR